MSETSEVSAGDLGSLSPRKICFVFFIFDNQMLICLKTVLIPVAGIGSLSF